MENAMPVAPVERLVGRRMRFLPAFREEIKNWKRVGFENEMMIRMFCCCVGMRMRGEDPATLLERRDEGKEVADVMDRDCE